MYSVISRVDTVLNMGDDAVEQIRGSNASISFSALDRESRGHLGANTYTAFSAAEHSLEESGDLIGDSKNSEDFPKRSAVHGIEGSLKIQESDVVISVLAEFLDLLDGETAGRDLGCGGVA